MATAPPHPSTRPFSDLVLDFLAYLELERGLSRNTLEAYRTDLQQFGVWLGEQDYSALEVTHTQLTDFIAQLGTGERGKGRAVAPATVQRKVACLRSFYRHLRREEIIDHDPTAQLRGPKRTQRLPKVLARAEVQKPPSQPQGASPPALRDPALPEPIDARGLRAPQ